MLIDIMKSEAESWSLGSTNTDTFFRALRDLNYPTEGEQIEIEKMAESFANRGDRHLAIQVINYLQR